MPYPPPLSVTLTEYLNIFEEQIQTLSKVKHLLLKDTLKNKETSDKLEEIFTVHISEPQNKCYT